MNFEPELSVVILCYRGEEHVVPFIEQVKAVLESRQVAFELVLVANYDAPESRDNTPRVVRALAQADNRYVCVAGVKRGMMGWDLREGLNVARGRTIAFLDGDGQTPATDILRLYDLLMQQNLDMCKVYRTARADSRTRKYISAFFNFAFAILFPGKRIRDINAKPKLLTRSALRQLSLTSTDWFIDTELMLEVRRHHLRFAEIPGVAGENTWRRSFIGFPALLEFVKNLLAYRIRYWFTR